MLPYRRLKSKECLYCLSTFIKYMNNNKIGWVITSIENLDIIENFNLNHCELGFIHQNEQQKLLQLLPELKCTFGLHFPLFRFGDTIPSSTEYALLDFN